MESTNSIQVTEEDIREAERIEMNPEMILRLVDLLFLGYDDRKNIPS